MVKYPLYVKIGEYRRLVSLEGKVAKDVHALFEGDKKRDLMIKSAATVFQ